MSNIVSTTEKLNLEIREEEGNKKENKIWKIRDLDEI